MAADGKIKLTAAPSPASDDAGLVVFGEQEVTITFPTGVIHSLHISDLSLTEFHLPGQHDQSTHGRKGGGSGIGARKATAEGRPGEPQPTRGIQKNQKPDAELRADLKKTYGKDVEKRITDAGHKVEDYNYYQIDDAGNKKIKGTPLPGTDSWRDAHGISKEVYDSRPNVRWTGKDDPVLQEYLGDFTKEQGYTKDNLDFTKTKIANQSDGFIMVRKPPPGGEELFGKIPPQARPDQPVVLNPATRAKKLRELESAKDRAENVKDYTSADVIKERQKKVNTLKSQLDELDTKGPESIKKELAARQDKANVANKAAEALVRENGTPANQAKLKDARIEKYHADEDSNNRGAIANIALRDPERAKGIVQQKLANAEGALTKAKADPEGTLDRVQKNAIRQIDQKQNQYDKTAIKYAFPPGENAQGKGGASRIEANQDPQNLKNLVEGKGRVYFVMEGNIKADAALTAVKKEDPKAAVVSVPSVTAWDQDEVDWIAKTHLKGRDVILIPDSDGVTNKNVVTQATKLELRLQNGGVGSVKVAAPPLLKNSRGQLKNIEDIYYPTGKADHRKGLDDHLGLGKGTLGDLAYTEKIRPDFKDDLSKAATAAKVRPQAHANMQKSMAAISEFAGEKGIERISKNSIESASGVPSTSVISAIDNLEKAGIIKVHRVFDPNELAKKRRVPLMDEDSIGDLYKRVGLNPPDLDKVYLEDDEAHETPDIIEILKPEYITKPGKTKNLKSDYKSLTTSDRIVRTKEGAERYNVPIGSPVPGAELGTMDAVVLTPFTHEFHLPGKHDQSTHGHGGGSGGSLGVGARKISSAQQSVLTQAQSARISGAEKKAVDSYVMNGYIDINDRLRGKSGDTPTIHDDWKEVDQKIGRLDSAFNKGAVSTNGITVHRGTNHDTSKLKVGDVLSDDAFWSTSVDKGEIEDFIAGRGELGEKRRPNAKNDAVLMRIKTGNDTKAVAGNRYEKELILNRGTSIKIKNIEHCPDGICRIDAEVV